MIRMCAHPHTLNIYVSLILRPMCGFSLGCRAGLSLHLAPLLLALTAPALVSPERVLFGTHACYATQSSMPELTANSHAVGAVRELCSQLDSVGSADLQQRGRVEFEGGRSGAVFGSVGTS